MAADTHKVEQSNVILRASQTFINYILTLQEDDLQQKIEFIIKKASLGIIIATVFHFIGRYLIVI